MGRSSPCGFYHAGWRVRTVVHGDDFVSEGPDASVRRMYTEMRKKFSFKTEVMGGGDGDVKKFKVLNTQLSLNRGEILWEADPKHIEILAEQLGLVGVKAMKTPGKKIDGDKTFRQCELEDGGDQIDAVYVDELLKTKVGRSEDEASAVSIQRCWACEVGDSAACRTSPRG